MPAALARAAEALGDRGLARGASRDSFTFDPWLLTSGGPDNGRLPDPRRRAPRSPTAPTRGCSRCSPPPTPPAGAPHATSPASSAAWYFGANPAGEPMYDPATGRTFDGISATATSTATRAPSRRSTGCCRCSRSTRTPTWPRRPGPREIVARAGHADRSRPRTATLAGDATAVTPDVAVDRGVAVRRLRLRRARRRRLGHARRLRATRGSLVLPVRRPASPAATPSPRSAPARVPRLGRRPATSARRATPRHPARCCR